MDPLDQLPLPLQLLIGGATFVFIFVVGHFLILLTGVARGLFVFAWGTGRAEDSDDSRRSMVVPAKYADPERALRDLGYVPFGTMRRRYPRMKGGATYHIRVSQDGQTFARFAEDSPPQTIVIATWFDEDSVVVTSYPTGEAFADERIASGFLRGSLAAAQAYHDAQVAERTLAGHTPKLLPDMAAYVEHQAVLRERHDTRCRYRIRNGLLLIAVPAVIAIIGVIGLIISIYKAEAVWAAAFGALAGLSVWARGRLERDYRERFYRPAGAADDAPHATKMGS